jgi:hypothetical protein
MALTIAALAILAGAAWAIGAATLAVFEWPDLRRFERMALELTAGFGLVAALASIALLLHAFSWTTGMLVAAAAGAVGVRARCRRQMHTPTVAAGEQNDSPIAPAAVITLAACAVVACAGAIAPVTDHDALSYVVPIAHHIVRDGALHVWPDQAPSMWPQSHTVLLAYIVSIGGNRLGALSAVEWLIAIGAIAALARRACERPGRAPLAVALAIAAPAAAFQVAAAKEDMLLLAATAAALFCLTGPRTIANAAGAGLFAGVAAGAKYPGVGVGVAVAAWIGIAWHGQRVRATLAAIACGAAVGGVWYALNTWRFLNPVAPFAFGAAGTPLDAHAVRIAMDNYGGGRGMVNLIATPFRIFLEQTPYAGRAGLFHPLTLTGIAAVAIGRLRARHGPLLFTAAVLYAGWYFTLQNARLLLPAAMLLAPAAADILAPAIARRGWMAAAVVAAVGAPLALAPVVGIVRAARYLSDPSTYLARETEHYSGIEWANAHLDRSTHRVLSMYGPVGYFTVPAVGLDPLHQMEFDASAMRDHDRLLAACRRQRVTHIFTARHDLDDVAAQLRLVFEDPRSPLGDAHFFRPAPVEATAIFEVLPAGPRPDASLNAARAAQP